MNFKPLARFFPVPRFLRTPMVGFDISNDSIKLLEIKDKNGRLSVGVFAESALPKGCIERGDVKHSDVLKKHLIQVREKHNLKYIAVSLPEERSYIFSLTIPNVSPKDIRGSIELQLEEHIPLSSSEVVFDYAVTSINQESGDITLSVSALPLKIVESYLSILEETGYIPLVFETEAQALARSIIPYDDSETFMIVDFGNTRSMFSIVENGTPAFNATIDFGGGHITEAIKKQLSITFEEAEKIKVEKGIARDTEDEIFSSAISTLAVLKDEVNKYYTYWNSRVSKDTDKKNPVKKIYFCGGASALKGLNEFLSGYLEVPFQLANVWVNVISVEKEIPPIEKTKSLQYATAIGLGLNNARHD
tara:strand:- start:395 stop:1480 length:1086 start_codon:yes stop_codon:yes gene_type:complete